MKAGLTGWHRSIDCAAQPSIANRAEWDNLIENWSLALDMKILALTIPAVFRRAEGDPTGLRNLSSVFDQRLFAGLGQ